MRFKTHGAWLLLAGLTLSAVIGCNEDNEKTAKISSVPPPPGSAPPPRDQREYFKQKGGEGSTYKASGYPGSSNR